MSAILNIVEKNKVCTRCDERKCVSQYGKHKATSDGLRPECKSCRRDAYKASRVAAGKIEDERKTVQLIEGGRVCNICEEGKSWAQFAGDIYGYNNKTATCKSCRNAKYVDPRGSTLKDRPDKVMRLYGITYEHVVQTLANQFGMCANRACGKEISLEVPLGVGRAVIDHNHTTGKFRALLCSGCNSLLGSIETKKNIMIGLNEYLTKHK